MKIDDTPVTRADVIKMFERSTPLIIATALELLGETRAAAAVRKASGPEEQPVDARFCSQRDGGGGA